MQKTKYLYGVGPEKYSTLQIDLAEEKIRDAKKLLKQLRVEVDNLSDPFRLSGIYSRVEAVNQAIKFNEDLIAEAKGEEV